MIKQRSEVVVRQVTRETFFAIDFDSYSRGKVTFGYSWYFNRMGGCG